MGRRGSPFSTLKITRTQTTKSSNANTKILGHASSKQGFPKSRGIYGHSPSCSKAKLSSLKISLQLFTNFCTKVVFIRHSKTANLLLSNIHSNFQAILFCLFLYARWVIAFEVIKSYSYEVSYLGSFKCKLTFKRWHLSHIVYFTRLRKILMQIKIQQAI